MRLPFILGASRLDDGVRELRYRVLLCHKQEHLHGTLNIEKNALATVVPGFQLGQLLQSSDRLHERVAKAPTAPTISSDNKLSMDFMADRNLDPD
jgi:hypothetical protein